MITFLARGNRLFDMRKLEEPQVSSRVRDEEGRTFSVLHSRLSQIIKQNQLQST